ncbi:MAG TPA: putative ABC exporter domain-containing protein [Terriglobales bacterium]|nr:putative ABC exporter domain-containing protein [Terriglobales bacterium]
MRWPPATWTALPWLDWRLLRNRARMIARSPRRLVPWLLFLVLLVPNLVSRLMVASAARRNPGVEPFAMVLNAVGHYVPGVALVVLGLALWQAGGRPPAAFQSPADGRFLVGAGMPSRLVLTWLALRRARRLLLAGFFYLVLLAVSVPGNGLSGAQLVAGTAGLTAYLWLIFGARVVLFAVQTRLPGVPVAWVGLAIAALGVAALGATGAGLAVAGPLDALPPGGWLAHALSGGLRSAGLLATLAIALAGAGVAAAGDCLPELWVASSRGFELRRQMRQGGLGGVLAARTWRDRTPRRVAAVSLPSVWAPPGAWALAWKEWLTVLRVRGGLQFQAALLLGAVVAGTVAGVLTVDRPPLVILVLAYALFLFSVLTNLLAFRLAADLRSPLWWLAADALWWRLGVLTLARAARLGVPLALFGAVLTAMASGQAWLAPGFGLVAVTLAWMISALGLASYTILPAASDLRVAQMLRVFALYGALVPVGIAVVPGVFAQSLPLVLAGGTLTLGAETILLIAFAASRLQGNGLAFAREERH